MLLYSILVRFHLVLNCGHLSMYSHMKLNARGIVIANCILLYYLQLHTTFSVRSRSNDIQRIRTLLIARQLYLVKRAFIR